MTKHTAAGLSTVQLDRSTAVGKVPCRFKMTQLSPVGFELLTDLVLCRYCETEPAEVGSVPEDAVRGIIGKVKSNSEALHFVLQSQMR